jgi:hypothetical protein
MPRTEKELHHDSSLKREKRAMISLVRSQPRSSFWSARCPRAIIESVPCQTSLDFLVLIALLLVSHTLAHTFGNPKGNDARLAKLSQSRGFSLR